MRLIDADALMKEVERTENAYYQHGREFSSSFLSSSQEISTEWYVVEDMIENAPTIELTQTNTSNTLDALDCVERQAALDALEWKWAGKAAIDAIKDLPSVSPRWIPVTERLPKPYSGEYLVTINDGSVYIDILWFDSLGDGRYESCFHKTDDDGYGVVYDDVVVAWMPLPQPWKGADDETD